MSEEASPKEHVRTPETDEVLRRVGRNVVLFQQVEQLLKFLNAHSTAHGPASKLAARVEAQVAAVHKSTMGDLAGKLVSGVLEPQDEHQTPDQIDEPWVGFRFSVGVDAEFVDRHDQEMRALVDARNDLIHHFPPRWQAAVDGDAEGALTYLDAQRAETVRMSERLQNWARSLALGRKLLADFMASPDGECCFELAFLQSTRLVAMLEIAVRKARADGWTLLSTAGQLIKRKAATELEDLHERLGHANLKGVLLASELFEVADEPTPGGGTRTIYRINDRYELQIASEQSPAVLGEGAPRLS